MFKSIMSMIIQFRFIGSVLYFQDIIKVLCEEYNLEIVNLSGFNTFFN